MHPNSGSRPQSPYILAGNHQAALGDREDERHHGRGGHAGVGAVAGVVAVGLVVEAAVGALGHREPPAIGVHQLAEAVGIECSRRAPCRPFPSQANRGYRGSSADAGRSPWREPALARGRRIGVGTKKVGDARGAGSAHVGPAVRTAADLVAVPDVPVLPRPLLKELVGGVVIRSRSILIPQRCISEYAKAPWPVSMAIGP